MRTEICDQLGIEFQARQVGFKGFQAGGGPVDGDHPCARTCQLGGLAAGGGAQIGYGFTRNIAQQPCRQGSRCVLHPPDAFVITGEFRDMAGTSEPDRTGGKYLAAEFFGPQPGIHLWR